jgi:VWFA-related protein
MIEALTLHLAVLLLQDPATFRADVTLVTVPCAVTGTVAGNPVPILKPDDFRLYADGVIQKIQNLWTEDELPLELGIILDVSDSQHAHTTERRTAVTHFLERMIGPKDRGFVVEVNEDVLLKQEVTHGPYGLRYKFLPPRGEPFGFQCGTRASEGGRRRPLCGGTALWNAVYSAAQLKLNRPQGSKALLILSDGNDTGSTHNLDAALAEVELSGAVVYAVRYPDELELNSTDTSGGLRRLAAETGGMIFDPPPTDYSEILARVEADLRKRYILGFRPEPGPGRHSLRIEVPSGLTVRARRVYFDSAR